MRHGPAAVACLLAAGLGWGAASRAATTATPPANVTPRARAAAAPAAVTLRQVSFDEWQKVLAAERGHPVVVDLWATWCLPCLDRLPHLVALAQRYAPQGVRFLTLSLDDTTDEQALAFARRFLTEKRATFPNYLLDEPMGSSFDKLGIAGVPAVLVYDRNGKLARKLTTDDPNAQFTDDDVERAIRELVGPPGGSEGSERASRRRGR